MSKLARWVARVRLRGLVVFLAAGIVVMAVMGIGAVMVDRGNPWFDLDAEIALRWPLTQSTIAFPALWSGALLVAAAIVWAAAWSVWPRERSRPMVLIVSLFFLLMSGDELAGLHERLEKRLGIDWQVLYALPVLLMAIGTVVVIRRMRVIDRHAMVLLVLGIAAWGISQVLEFVQWHGDEPIPAYVFLMVPEELLEATGSALFLVSGVCLVRTLVRGSAAAGPEQASAAAGDPAGGR